MKIKSIYIGGWFQRTMLQLSEIYDFLRDGSSQAGLESAKLLSLRDNLHIESIEYGVANEEFVAFVTDEHIRVKLFEDGLMTVSSDEVSESTMIEDIERVHNYYEQNLSPAINYLFSMGAPVFKELSRVENIYPYFIICENASQKDISELLAKTEQQKYFEFDGKNYSVLRGDKYYFVNNKKSSLENIEHYIEEQVFIREFKGQLHRYLNLHRAIWSKIDNIKKRTYFNEAEILSAENKLDRYEKTTLLIESRLEQMSPYVKIREAGMKGDAELEEFLAISGFRHEALIGTLTYMRSLWGATHQYSKSAMQLLERAERERMFSHVRGLILLVSLSVVIGALGLIFGTGLKFSVDTIIYSAILVIALVISGKIIKVCSEAKQHCLAPAETKEEA